MRLYGRGFGLDQSSWFVHHEQLARADLAADILSLCQASSITGINRLLATLLISEQLCEVQ